MTIRILIVEDGAHFADLIQRTVTTLERLFPNPEIITTNSFSAAARIVAHDTPQDVVILDLTLSDSTMEQSISRISELDDHAPTVIVTAAPKSLVEKMLGVSEVPVVEKGPELFSKGWLTGVLVETIRAWHRRKERPLRENLRVLEAFNSREANER